VVAGLAGGAADRPGRTGKADTADTGDHAVYLVQVYPVGDRLGRPGKRSGSASQPASRDPARLIDLIRTVVRPDSWGDPRASIAVKRPEHLTIAQTAAGHVAVGRLLDDLRVHRATQVAIRVRLLTYHRPETLGLITSAMRLETPGPAHLILDPEETARLVAALEKQPDVQQFTARPLAVVSGGGAHVSIGTETILSTRWRANEGAPEALTRAPIRLSAFEGTTLLVGATASADGSSVALQVNATATLLAGGHTVADDWGGIDLPEFAASRVCVTARVPSGHALLVGGLRTKVEEPATRGTQTYPLPRRRDAAVLVVLIPTVEAPHQAVESSARGGGRAVLDLESMAVLARMRRWAPDAPPAAASQPGRAAALNQITIASADGLVTLQLNLAESGVRTPAVKEWLRRLLDRPGARAKPGGAPSN